MTDETLTTPSSTTSSAPGNAATTRSTSVETDTESGPHSGPLDVGAPTGHDHHDHDYHDGLDDDYRDESGDRFDDGTQPGGVVGRVMAWYERPWTSDRIWRTAFTAASLITTFIVMAATVHILPPPFGTGLVWKNTTPTGGDFGAHVWGPAVLRDSILPSGWFNGWSMDWYAGLPTYRFYMVLPAFAILITDLVLPYGIAMKFVSVLGVLAIPAACWAFGRLARFRYPMPSVFAFAGLAFVLDESYKIYGGNLKSTMAGEFSFSIALAISILSLGVLARGLETGKFRVWAAALMAIACVSHGLVLIFTALAAFVFSLVWVDSKRAFYIVSTGVTTLLLAAWWVGPFLLGHDYMTDMKYQGEPVISFDSWWDMFFPLTAPLDFIVTTLAFVGFIYAIIRRNLNAAALGVLTILLVGLVWVTRNSLPGLGLLWNPRLLPFFYLVRYLLMAYGAIELLGLLGNLFRNRAARELPSTRLATGYGAGVAVVILVILGFMFQALPFGGNVTVTDAEGNASARYRAFGITATETNTLAAGDQWASYNFAGYEGRGQYWNEYRDLVLTMTDIGAEYGCGRANWENHADNGDYGTTMALMLLPHWTDGCIGSMEGLFFEASGTTPYHFLTTAALSESSSNPVRGLRYTNTDGALGVELAEQLGIKYVMVRTDAAQAEAADQPELEFVGESGPWEIYLLTTSSVVEPLSVQPVVVNERRGDPRERMLEVSTSWFQNQSSWLAMPANDGPPEWQRIDVAPDETLVQDRTVDVVQPVTPIEPVALPEITVSNLEIKDQSLSFEVDQVGVPVLVRVSYFPNWSADGAQGPYRIGPNMMVVVPTETTVSMSYDQNSVDYLMVLLTLVGIGLCFYWRFGRGDEDFSALPAATAIDATSVDHSGDGGDPPERSTAVAVTGVYDPERVVAQPPPTITAGVAAETVSTASNETDPEVTDGLGDRRRGVHQNPSPLDEPEPFVDQAGLGELATQVPATTDSDAPADTATGSDHNQPSDDQPSDDQPGKNEPG